MKSKFWIGGGSRIWFDDEYVRSNGIFTINFVEEDEGAYFNSWGDREICCDLTLTDVRDMIRYLSKIEKEMELVNAN